MSRLITAAQATELGLPTDQQERSATLRAAGLLLAHVEQHPFAAEADVRKWAERREIGPDRFNAAARYLENAGHLHRVDSPPQPPTSPVAALGDLTAFKKDTLLDIAQVLEVDVPKSATKDDIAQRLTEGPA